MLLKIWQCITMSPHLVWSSLLPRSHVSHSHIPLAIFPLIPTPTVHKLYMPLGLNSSISWKKPNVPLFRYLYLHSFWIESAAGWNNNNNNNNKMLPFGLCCGFCPSAMLSVVLEFWFTEMCECPSQLPRTQPVHITAKRHKLGSQGMRKVQITSCPAFFCADALARAKATSALCGFVL